MLLKLYADKRCVSVIELLLVRNLYEHGHPEPDPNVSVSFTPQQREAASNLFRFHRLKQTGAEWKSFQYAVLNGRNRTPDSGADFGQGLEGYTEFLDLTKKLCSKVSGQTLDNLQTEPSAFKQQRFPR